MASDHYISITGEDVFYECRVCHELYGVTETCAFCGQRVHADCSRIIKYERFCDDCIEASREQHIELMMLLVRLARFELFPRHDSFEEIMKQVEVMANAITGSDSLTRRS